MRVIFPLVKAGAAVQYPDAAGLFANTDLDTSPGNVIADYSGQQSLQAYTPPGARVLSKKQYLDKMIQIAGQTKMAHIALQQYTDGDVALIIVYLTQAGEVHLDDAVTANMLGGLQAKGYLSAQDVAGILA